MKNKKMKLKDYVYVTEANFENRLFYAQLMTTYDNNLDSKYGYLDGAKECLECYKSIDELETHINEFERSQVVLDEYDKAFILSYRDYIKQEKSKEVVTNEQ